MGPDAHAFWRDDRPGLARQVAVEEFAERALADEADAGRILLRVVRQARLGRERPHLGLFQFPEGKKHPRKLRLVQPVQEIALVLRWIEAAMQLE